VYFFLALVIIAVIIAIALIAAGSTDSLSEAYPDRRYLELPAERSLRPADLQGVRLGVGFRGYRMDEVDHLLDRLAYELELRDIRIAELESSDSADEGSADAAEPEVAERAGPSTAT
jgi:DivIVA domain-containing protein